MKYMLWYTAVPGRKYALQEWLVAEFAEAALQLVQGLTSVRVNTAVPEPVGLELYGNSETNGAVSSDAIVEVTLNGERAAAQLLMFNESAGKSLIQSCHVYEVEEDEVFSSLDSAGGVPSQGLKLMRGLFFLSDLPDSAIRRSWKHHQDLAVKVHTGLVRYACIWVHRSLTPGAPPIQGVSVLHFPSIEDMRENYFDSARGRSEIIHDIGHFISGGTSRMFAKEFVYRRDNAVSEAAWSLWPMP
ncbi:hypothetical protein AB0N24_25815 [Arthrobacter sp. NPDC093128]|uniref:hypothetical protein n=1 Tax=Arthrobacter sp. NPDC093128 TaxID=3154979 RepID=UPI00344262E4